jgi:hypothetical protein
MQSRSSNTSTTTILLIVLLIVTFPVWIGLAGGILGGIIGIFGTVIGAVMGLFGAVLGGILSLFGHLFSWNFHGPFVFWNTSILTVFAIILLCVVLSKRHR